MFSTAQGEMRWILYGPFTSDSSKQMFAFINVWVNPVFDGPLRDEHDKSEGSAQSFKSWAGYSITSKSYQCYFQTIHSEVVFERHFLLHLSEADRSWADGFHLDFICDSMQTERKMNPSTGNRWVTSLRISEHAMRDVVALTYRRLM